MKIVVFQNVMSRSRVENWPMFRRNMMPPSPGYNMNKRPDDFLRRLIPDDSNLQQKVCRHYVGITDF
jgi:hypothetical protein